jgi:hypothetical protein
MPQTEATMSNLLVMILVLALIAIAVFSPFAALSMLMLFLLVAAFGWAILTLVRTAFYGDKA